jgi:AcrR family transcriptional regulator
VTSTEKKLRADARRNNERLLEVAKQTFAELGTDCSLEEIARRAEVGIGTLYRHFPSREALVEAVYRREVEQLAEAARQLVATESPERALRQWFLVFLDYVATKKVIAPRLTSTPSLSESTTHLIREALTLLLDHALRARAIRSDVKPDDLMQALAGVSYNPSRPGWHASALRLIDIVMDGLQTKPARLRKLNR